MARTRRRGVAFAAHDQDFSRIAQPPRDAANSILQVTSGPRLLGQTVSLYMLAMRGGISIGALLTGGAVTLLGVRHAILLNGLAAVAIQVALARVWLRAPLPNPGPQIRE